MRCVDCGYERDFAPHLMTYAECELMMASRYMSHCASAFEHHAYRPDWRGWFEDLWDELREALR